MAVHHRLLYGSENGMWAQVAGHMVQPWSSIQSQALAEHSEPLTVSASAALRLYELAAQACWSLFDPRERRVVAHALTLTANH